MFDRMFLSITITYVTSVFKISLNTQRSFKIPLCCGQSVYCVSINYCLNWSTFLYWFSYQNHLIFTDDHVNYVFMYILSSKRLLKFKLGIRYSNEIDAMML